jgi:hypothetical protein
LPAEAHEVSNLKDKANSPLERPENDSFLLRKQQSYQQRCDLL